jgi:hypothetical protein
MVLRHSSTIGRDTSAFRARGDRDGLHGHDRDGLRRDGRHGDRGLLRTSLLETNLHPLRRKRETAYAPFLSSVSYP